MVGEATDPEREVVLPVDSEDEQVAKEVILAGATTVIKRSFEK